MRAAPQVLERDRDLVKPSIARIASGLYPSAK
jgi:hypothetical protein